MYSSSETVAAVKFLRVIEKWVVVFYMFYISTCQTVPLVLTQVSKEPTNGTVISLSYYSPVPL
jgi:hypothetical protein